MLDDIGRSFADTIKQIEINRVLYGAKPGANDPFKSEWSASQRNCGGFTTCAINRALKTAGAPEDKLLPVSNLGIGQPKYLSEKFNTPLVQRFSSETLKQMGVGTVIAGTKPEGGTHVEMIVNHPVTGELVVASYGRAGKTIQYKTIDDKYANRLNQGKFSAANPFYNGQTTGHQLAGGGLKNQIMNYIIGQGFPPESAAGIIGNIAQEADFNPVAVNPKSKAFGLFQHLGSRKKGLFDFAKQQSRDPNDWRTQVDYALHELRSDPSWGLSELMKARDPREAASIFSKKFERAGAHETNDTRRMREAMVAYQEWSQGKAGTMVADATGQVVSGGEGLQQEEPKIPLLDLAASQAQGILTPHQFNFDIPASWQGLSRRGFDDAEG